MLKSLKITNMTRKVLRLSLFTIVAAYLGFCANFYFRQEAYLFEPLKEPTGMRVSNHKGLGKEFTLTKREGDDGEIRYRKYITPTEPSSGTVFYLHGNRGDMDKCEWEIDFLIDCGYDV